VSVNRAITENHGEAMLLASQKPGSDLPDHPGVAILIAEMDGSMVPQVETAEPVEGEAPIDRRKTRKVSWTEALLCLMREPGSVTPVFGATMGYRKRSWRSSVGVRYIVMPEPEARPSSMVWAMGPHGLPIRWI